MTENNPAAFSVLAAEERLPDFAALAKAVGEVRGLNADDAARAARHAWGFIAEGLGEAAAAEAARRCGLLGVKALAVPAAALPPARPPLRIRKAVISEGAFAYTGADGAAGSAGKDDILLLAAAPARSETVRTVKVSEGASGQERAIRFGIMAVTGLPIGLGRSRETQKAVKSSEVSFRLDIFLRPGALRLGVDPGDFDFSCLKEKKTCSSQTNLRLLCSELAAFTPRALKNAGLSAMLEGRPLSALPYDGPEDLEKELQRLTAITRLRGTGGD